MFLYFVSLAFLWLLLPSFINIYFWTLQILLLDCVVFPTVPFSLLSRWHFPTLILVLWNFASYQFPRCLLHYARIGYFKWTLHSIVHMHYHFLQSAIKAFLSNFILFGTLHFCIFLSKLISVVWSLCAVISTFFSDKPVEFFWT